MAVSAKTQKRLARWRKDGIVFYSLMMLFPVAQFAIFYIGVNFNSFLMAFQEIDIAEDTVTWTFQNFRQIWLELTEQSTILSVTKVSLLSYALLLVIGTPLGLLFSYYIYKKLPFAGGFRVILFLPSIISAVVMVTIFQFYVERAVPAYVNKLFGKTIEGLLTNIHSRYSVIIFYNIWIGFGTGVLLYSNGMSGISQDVVESAHLDGADGFREFWHITLPLVYPTLSTFLITGVAGIFTNQINLYSFYGAGAPVGVQTFGYYLYTQTQAAVSDAAYPRLAAIGFILTLIAVPLTLAVKWVLEKFGPSED